MWRRYVSRPLQAALVALAWGIFAVLPVDAASGLGGWLARKLGPRLGVSRTARRNLQRIFPNLAPAEIERIVIAMWDNLGRTAAEHPHLARLAPGPDNPRVELVGTEHVAALRDDGKPGIFFSGHLANWELGAIAISAQGVPPHIVYRASNNPWVDRLITGSRRALGGTLLPKGAEGARMSLRALRDGGHLAMVVDQKMNDGIAVPFMGVTAMTAPALAQLALRYDCPVVPVRVERLTGARFRVTFHAPLALPDTADRHAAVAAMMATVNDLIGGWVRERPEQWLWVHNRWPPEAGNND